MRITGKATLQDLPEGSEFYAYREQLIEFMKKEKREIKQAELGKLFNVGVNKYLGILRVLSNYMPNLYETDNGKLGVYPYSYNEG